MMVMVVMGDLWDVVMMVMVVMGDLWDVVMIVMGVWRECGLYLFHETVWCELGVTWVWLVSLSPYRMV